MPTVRFMEKNGKLLMFLRGSRGYRDDFLSMPNLTVLHLKILIRLMMLFMYISNTIVAYLLLKI